MTRYGSTTNSSPSLKEIEAEDVIICNGQSNSNTKHLLQGVIPKDHYLFTYFIFYLLGITTLLPWNFFITADSYWMYKFRNVNQTNFHDITERTQLQAEFESYVSISSAVPTLVFYFINSAVAQWVSFHKRMIGALLTMFFLFLITALLINVNTDTWQNEFFLITMSTVVLLNAAGTVMGGTLYGITGKFSPHYITACYGGQALGGIFASIVQIICLAVGATAIESALLYFIIGCTTIITSLVMYIMMSRTLFFIFYIHKALAVSNKSESKFVTAEEVSYKRILKKVWKFGICVGLVYIVSMAVYPGITVLVESERKAPRSVWTNVYWVPTINYLLYNIGDYVGRMLAGCIQKPKSGNIQLIIASARFLCIPLIMMSNAHPREHLPVLFNKDWMYVIIIATAALTNGYCANLAIISTPLSVQNHEKETASTVSTIFIGTGLIIGSSMSVVFVKLL